MKITAALLLLIPQIANAFPDFGEIAKGMNASKKGFFSVLAREEIGETRHQKALKTVLARDVLCKIESKFAEEHCAETTALNIRTLNGFPAEAMNIRIALRALAGILDSARATLPAAPKEEADSLLARVGAALTRDLNPAELDALADEILAQKALWAELSSSAFRAYPNELAAWLKLRPVAPTTPKYSGTSNLFCAIENKRVNCYGSNLGDVLNVPGHFKDPVAVAAANRHACVIDQGRVQCWGYPLQGSVREGIPENLSHPYAIQINDTAGCVLDDNGLQCWGKGSERSQKLAAESKGDITDFVFYDDRPCVLDGGYLRCAGIWKDGSSIDTLKNPRALTIGHNPCVVDDAGPHCWQSEDGSPQDISFFSRKGITQIISYQGKYWPIKISAVDPEGYFYQNTEFDNVPKLILAPHPGKTLTHLGRGMLGDTCMEEEGELRCDGWFLSSYRNTLSSAEGITQIDAQSSCVLRSGHVECWGPQSTAIEENFSHFANPLRWFHAETYGYQVVATAWDGENLSYRTSRQGRVEREWSLPLIGVKEFAQENGSDNSGNLILTDSGPLIWRNYPNGKEAQYLPVPEWMAASLEGSSQITKTHGSTCAIKQGAVKCYPFWPKVEGSGIDIKGEISPPAELNIKGATLLASTYMGRGSNNGLGENHESCALDESGIKCWANGRPEWSHVSYPNPFLSPKKMVIAHGGSSRNGRAASIAACALGDGNLRCVGLRYEGENPTALPVPPMQNIRDVDEYRDRICAVHAQGVTCWNYYED